LQQVMSLQLCWKKAFITAFISMMIMKRHKNSIMVHPQMLKYDTFACYIKCLNIFLDKHYIYFQRYIRPILDVFLTGIMPIQM
jgi:hypothetical protein